MKQKITYRLLQLVAALLLAPASTWAWSGSGTSVDPFVLTDEADLQNLATNVNAGNYDAVAVYVELGSNIVCTGTFTTPIGQYDDHPFSGQFDGKGYTISGMSLTKDGDYVGLFGYIARSIHFSSTQPNPAVKNLTITDATITSTGSNAAALAGYILNGSVDNVTVSNTNIVTNGSIEKSNIGGVIGYIQSGSVTNVTVKGVVVNNAEPANSSSVGAIIGGITPSVTLTGNKYDIHSTINNNKYATATGYWDTKKADVNNLIATYGANVRPGVAIGTTGDTYSFDLKGQAEYKTTTLAATIAAITPYHQADHFIYNFGEEIIPVWTGNYPTPDAWTTGVFPYTATTGEIHITDDAIEIPHNVYVALTDENDITTGDVTSIVTWTNNINVGTATGNFTLRNEETVSANFTIEAYDLGAAYSTATMAIDPTEVIYKGADYTVKADNTGDIKLTSLTATYKKNDGTDATHTFYADPSTLNVEFTIVADAQTNVGTYDFTVNGKAGNFTGTITKQWEIKPLKLHQGDATKAGYVTFSAIADDTYTYDGNEKKPEPTISIVMTDGAAATAFAGTLTYAYDNNINAWVLTGEEDDTDDNKPKVTVTALTPGGNFTLPAGTTDDPSLFTNFKIQRAPIDGANKNDYILMGGSALQRFPSTYSAGSYVDGTEVIYDGSDFIDNVKSFLSTSTAPAAFTWKKYKGSSHRAMVLGTDYEYNWYGLDANSNGAWDAEEKVTELKNVLYDGSTVADYTFVITAHNNYKGTRVAYLKIAPRDFATYNPTITVTSKVYNTCTQVATEYTVKNDKGVELTESDVTYNGTNTAEMTKDYFVKTNNGGIDAGKYNVEIEASPKGNYTGTYTFTNAFEITKKSIAASQTDIVVKFIKPTAYVDLATEPTTADDVNVKYTYTGSAIAAIDDVLLQYNWVNNPAAVVAEGTSGTKDLVQATDYTYGYKKYDGTTYKPCAASNVKDKGLYKIEIYGNVNYTSTRALYFKIEAQHINSKYIKVAFVDNTDAANEIKTKSFNNGLAYTAVGQNPQLKVWYDANDDNKNDGTEYNLVQGTDYDITLTDWAGTTFYGSTWPAHARRVDVVLTGKGNWDNTNDGSMPAYEDNTGTDKTKGGYYYAVGVTNTKTAETVAANLLTNQNVATGIHYWIEPRDMSTTDNVEITHAVDVTLDATVNLTNANNTSALAFDLTYTGNEVTFANNAATEVALVPATMTEGDGADHDYTMSYEGDCKDNTKKPTNVKYESDGTTIAAYEYYFKNNGMGNYKNDLTLYFKIIRKHIGNHDTYVVDDENTTGLIVYAPATPITDQEYTGKYIVDQIGSVSFDATITDNPSTPEDERLVTSTDANAYRWVKDYSTNPFTFYDAIAITDNGNSLTLGTDYEILFKNNLKPGAATIEVKGIGNYDYNFAKTFEIVRKKIWGVDIVNVKVPEVDVLLDNDAPLHPGDVDYADYYKKVILYSQDPFTGELLQLNYNDDPTKDVEGAKAWVEWMTWKDEDGNNATGHNAHANKTYTVTAKVWLGDDTPIAQGGYFNPAETEAEHALPGTTWYSNYFEFGDPLDAPNLRINSKQANSHIQNKKNITIDYTFIMTAGQPEFAYNPETRRLTLKVRVNKEADVNTYLVYQVNDDEPVTIGKTTEDNIISRLDDANKALYESASLTDIPYYSYELPAFGVNSNVTARIDYQKNLPSDPWTSTIEEVSRGKLKTDKYFVTAAPAVGQIANTVVAEQIDAQVELASLPDAVRPTAQIGTAAGENVTGAKIYYIKTTSDTDDDAFDAASTNGELAAAIDWHNGLYDNKAYEALGTDEKAKMTLGNADKQLTNVAGEWKEYTAEVSLDADPLHKYTTYYFIAKDGNTEADPADPHYGYSEITKYRAEKMLELTADHEWKTYYAKEIYLDYDGITEKSIDGFKVIGADVYNITATNPNAGTITLSAISTDMPKEQPVLLRTKNDAQKIYLSSLRYEVAGWNGGTSATEFVGAAEATTIDGAAYDYFVLNNEEFVKVDENPADAANKVIPAHRSWLQYTDGSYPALARMRFVFDEADAIEALTAEDVKNGEWYDLNGRKLDNAPVRKGLYIFNGRKVVIK